MAVILVVAAANEITFPIVMRQRQCRKPLSATTAAVGKLFLERGTASKSLGIARLQNWCCGGATEPNNSQRSHS